MHCIDDTNENKKIGIFGLFDLNWGGDDDTWKSIYENPCMEVLWCEATWIKPLLPHDVYNQNLVEVGFEPKKKWTMIFNK